MNKFLRKLSLSLMLIALIAGGLSGLAQNAAREEVLTNETIVSLTKANLPPAVIVNKIKSSKTNFDTSTSELLRLKQTGVSDEVINSMVLASSPVTANATNETAKADPNDPASLHDSGIYILEDASSARRLVQLEPAVVTQAKTAGIFSSAMTYGIKK